MRQLAKKLLQQTQFESPRKFESKLAHLPLGKHAIPHIDTAMSIGGLLKHASQIPLLAAQMVVAREVSVHAKPCATAPVIFVHGYQANHATFYGMKRYFKRRGRKQLYAIKLNWHLGFAGMAAQLTSYVDHVLQVNQLPQGTRVDLVTHSLGGLISRWALLCSDFGAKVRTLVTMGTPHFGTAMAKILPSELGYLMRPNSEVIGRLTQQLSNIEHPDFPRLVCIWSRKDVFVIPASNGQVPGAENIEMSQLGHYDFLLHQTCWRRVMMALS